MEFEPEITWLRSKLFNRTVMPLVYTEETETSFILLCNCKDSRTAIYNFNITAHANSTYTKKTRVQINSFIQICKLY